MFGFGDDNNIDIHNDIHNDIDDNDNEKGAKAQAPTADIEQYKMRVRDICGRMYLSSADIESLRCWGALNCIQRYFVYVDRPELAPVGTAKKGEEGETDPAWKQQGDDTEERINLTGVEQMKADWRGSWYSGRFLSGSNGPRLI